MSALLEAEAVAHDFGGAAVLQDVSLSLERGEFVAIIGPNGSGKSTLLRILARLQRPRAGVVRFDGRDLQTLAPRDVARRLGFLPQEPSAPPDLTVEELAWRGRYPHRGALGRSGPADRRAVTAALELTGLGGLRQRALATLSGGERRRSWIALALAQEPELLLLDEPTAHLDIAHQVELLTLLRRLNAEHSLTVLAVMHDLPLTAHYAQRLIAMREGRIVADGTPAAVITVERIAAVFGVAMRVYHDPETNTPVIMPGGL